MHLPSAPHRYPVAQSSVTVQTSTHAPPLHRVGLQGVDLPSDPMMAVPSSLHLLLTGVQVLPWQAYPDAQSLDFSQLVRHAMPAASQV